MGDTKEQPKAKPTEAAPAPIVYDVLIGFSHLETDAYVSAGTQFVVPDPQPAWVLRLIPRGVLAVHETEAP